MPNPVTTSAGNTYESAIIERWLDEHDTDPCTNLHLANKGLTPHAPLKEAYRKFMETTLERHPGNEKLFIPPPLPDFVDDTPPRIARAALDLLSRLASSAPEAMRAAIDTLLMHYSDQQANWQTLHDDARTAHSQGLNDLNTLLKDYDDCQTEVQRAKDKFCMALRLGDCTSASISLRDCEDLKNVAEADLNDFIEAQLQLGALLGL